MATKQLIIRIVDLKVTSNGDFPGTKPSHDDDLGLKNNSLMASLTYPRSGASQVMSVKQYDLADGSAAVLVNPEDPDPFFDPLLFREDVDDQTVLNVKVTNFDESGKATKFFLALFGVVFGAGVGAVTSGLSSVIGAIIGFGVDQIKSNVGSAGDGHVDVIGEAKLPIKVADFGAVGVTKQLDLIAPATIQRSSFVFSPIPGQGPVEQTINVTTKGQSNGTLTVEITAV